MRAFDHRGGDIALREVGGAFKKEIRDDVDNKELIIDEMGDVLFSLVNLSRFLNISAEDALRMTISKFEMRFTKVEKELKKRGKDFSDSNLEEMDEIWNWVKKDAI